MYHFAGYFHNKIYFFYYFFSCELLFQLVTLPLAVSVCLSLYKNYAVKWILNLFFLFIAGVLFEVFYDKD